MPIGARFASPCKDRACRHSKTEPDWRSDLVLLAPATTEAAGITKRRKLAIGFRFANPCNDRTFGDSKTNPDRRSELVFCWPLQGPSLQADSKYCCEHPLNMSPQTFFKSFKMHADSKYCCEHPLNMHFQTIPKSFKMHADSEYCCRHPVNMHPQTIPPKLQDACRL